MLVAQTKNLTICIQTQMYNKRCKIFTLSSYLYKQAMKREWKDVLHKLIIVKLEYNAFYGGYHSFLNKSLP